MDSYKLYDYQQTIYDEIPKRLARDGSVLVYSPMRSGKSKIIASTTTRIVQAAIQAIQQALHQGRVPLVLTHRSAVYKQLIEHCGGIGIDSDVDHVFIQPTKCYVAMKQTLVKRPNIITQLQALGNRLVLLVDEAHVQDFNSVIDLLPKALLTGFTATPVWKSAKHLPKYYKSLIHGPQISELITQGKFVPVDYYEMVSDLSELKKQSNGEYTEVSQEFVFGQSKLYDGLFTELTKFTFNKCAIFCSSKKACNKLLKEFNEHNNPAWKPIVYYSGLSDYELAKFTTLGQANIVITIRSLGTGWDYPPLDFAVLFCAIGSMPTFLQIASRICTPHPGKNTVTELDFGGNNSRFGGGPGRIALTMDRDWNALWQPPPKLPKEGGGVAAIKNCTACDFILSVSAKSCGNCGYVYPEHEIELMKGELVRIAEQAEADRQQVQGRRISSLDPIELAYYAKNVPGKKGYAMRVAKSHAVDQPEWAALFGAAMGYQKGWADMQLRNIAEERMYHLGPEPYKVAVADLVVNVPVVKPVIL